MLAYIQLSYALQRASSTHFNNEEGKQPYKVYDGILSTWKKDRCLHHMIRGYKFS